MRSWQESQALGPEGHSALENNENNRNKEQENKENIRRTKQTPQPPPILKT